MGTIVFFDKAKEELLTGGMNLSATMNCALLGPSFSPLGPQFIDIDTSSFSSSVSPYALGNLSGTSVAIRGVNGIGDMVNGLLQSNALTTSPWTSSLGVATKDQNDIYGSANSAWQIGDNSAAARQGTLQDVTIAANTNTHGFSFFVKKDTDETRFPAFVPQLNGGSNSYVFLGINTATGYIWETNGSGTYSYDCTLYTDSSGVEWWHVRCIITNNGGNTSARFEVYPAFYDASGGTTAAVSNTGNIITCGWLLRFNISALEDLPGFYVENGASTATAAIAVPDVTISASNAVSMDLSDVVFTASSSQNFSARYAVLVQSGIDHPLAYMELSTSTIVAHKVKIVWP